MTSRDEPPSQGPQWGSPWTQQWGQQWGGGWDKWMFPGSAGARQPVGGGVTARPVLERVVSLLRSRLLGRRLTVQTQRGELNLTLTGLEVPLDRAAVSMGQLDDVTIEATDVLWGDVRFESVRATLRNPHLRGGPPPELVAAPVDVRVTLTAGDLAALVAKAKPQVLVEVTEEEVVVRSKRHSGVGSVAVDVAVDGTRVSLRPRALARGDRSLRLPRRTPPVTFRLPLPAERVTVHRVEPRSGGVEVAGRLDQVHIPVPAGGLDELARRWGSLGTLLDLTRWAP